MEVTRAWKKSLKRGPKMSKGLVETVYVVELNDDKVKRRVYEKWSRTGKRTAFVVKVKEHLVTVTAEEIVKGEFEAERRFAQFLDSLS